MKKKFLVWLVIGILIVASLVRLYKLSVVQFDSDFGRDALFAARIFEGKLTLLGPKTSVGGFYLGPLYFYGVAAIFGLVGYMPEAVSFIFIIINILGLWWGYRLLASRFSPNAGIIFLLFGSTSPLLVLASRGATCWPMVLPVTVGWLALLFRSFDRKHYVWKVFSGMAFGLFLHIHFSGLIALPGYILLLLMYGGKNWKEKIVTLLLHLLGVTIMVIPNILFDLRHNFITSKAALQYAAETIQGKSVRSDLGSWTFGQKFEAIRSFIVSRVGLQWIAIVASVYGCIRFFNTKKLSFEVKRNFITLTIIMVSSLMMFFVYPGYIFDYYLVLPCVLVLLWLSVAMSYVPYRRFVYALVVVCAIVGLINLKPLYRDQFRTLPNLERIIHVIEEQIDKNPSQKFAVYKEGGDGMTILGYEYRFLLHRDGYVAVDENFYQHADVLYVIREYGDNDPLSYGNHEMRQFNPKAIIFEQRLDLGGKNVTVFALGK